MKLSESTLVHLQESIVPIVSSRVSSRSENSDFEAIITRGEKVAGMNFGSLIKKNPFEKDVKLYPKQNSSEEQLPKVDQTEATKAVAAEQSVNNSNIQDQTLTSSTKDNVERAVSAFKDYRRAFTQNEPRPSGFGQRALSETCSHDDQPAMEKKLKGILKIGTRSKFAQNYGYFSSDNFGRKSISPAPKMRKNSFASNSFDSDGKKKKKVQRSSSFKKPRKY